MRKVLVVLSLIVSVFGVQDGWYGSATPEEVTASVIYAGTDRIVVGYTVPGFNIEEVTVDSSSCYNVTLKKRMDSTDSTGFPKLPVLRDMLPMPECNGYSVSVEYSNPTVYDSILVCPFPEYSIDTFGVFSYSYVPDTAFYSNGSSFPDWDLDTIPGKIRQQNVLSTSLYPFIYDPSAQELTHYSTVSLTVTFTSSTSDLCLDVGPMRSSLEAALLYSDFSPTMPLSIYSLDDTCTDCLIAKIDSFPDTTTFLDTIFCDYLMIVADSLWGNPWLDSLALHRQRINHFDVVMIKFSIIDNLYPDETEYNSLDKGLSLLYNTTVPKKIKKERGNLVISPYICS